MQIVLLLLFISQVQLDDREKRFVRVNKRDVHTSSLQNSNRYTKTYEIGQKIIFDTPNFTLIDSLLSTNESKSSIRKHTTWLTRQISLNDIPYTEIARYDSNKNHFILNHDEHFSYTIDVNSGQLTLGDINNKNLLYTEISMHAESGLSKGDDILHDIYRLIRLSNASINCTTNVTINEGESIEISCTIEYDFLKYDDLNFYQPTINLTFYVKENNSLFTSIDQIQLNEIKDLQLDNKTQNWKRLITYRIKPISKEEKTREYLCMVIPDTLRNEDNNRICQTRINIRNDNSSTTMFPRLNKWDIIDISILVLIVLSSLLFIISFILCLVARQDNKKRIVQIKPETLEKRIALHHGTKRTYSKENLFTNNNEIKSEIPLITSKQFSEPSSRSSSSQQIHQHKPGCPKYIPSPEYNLLSTDLFTHTTIDNIKKIILPDIPQNNDLFDDQPYIRFYIPSKNENLSIKKLPSSSPTPK